MKRYSLTIAAVALTVLLGISAAFPVQAAEKAPDYEFHVPSLAERLTLSEDGRTATLFAPYTTKASGWYDANKNWYNDSHHCWAASCSNVIAWYQDACERIGCWDVSACERDVDRIFDRFRNTWDDLQGQDPIDGFNWYFTGGFSSGGSPEGYENRYPGGFLRDLPHCGEPWYMIDPANSWGTYGDNEAKFPMLRDENGKTYEGGSIYNHENFSKTIRQQLTYGACAAMVVSSGGSAATSHAITLWGCDYDVETGLISKIYVTDSDDEDRLPGHQLKGLKITAKNPDQDGVRIHGYYLGGSASPVDEFLGSTVLYAPGVVTEAENAVVSMKQEREQVLYQNHSETQKNVQAILAAYDEQGRFLGMKTERLELAPNQSTAVWDPLPARSGTLRSFALDMQGRPLCAAAALQTANR